MSNICAGPRPPAGCPYYVTWDANVLLADDWINVYGGGYSVGGPEWRRLGEAFIYPSSMVAQGYQGYNKEYFKSYNSLKLNPSNGGGYTLTGYGGMWGRAGGKSQADPDETFFYFIWSPTGKVTTTGIRFQLGGPPENWTDANREYYTNFGERCGGDPDFQTVSCDPPRYLGNASPPPPPPRRKKMSCCSCNDVATIVENQSILQLRAQEKLVENLKDHIDKRALEIIIKDVEHLKALDFEEFLKAIMQRINESEANLWNGVQQ